MLGYFFTTMDIDALYPQNRPPARLGMQSHIAIAIGFMLDVFTLMRIIKFNSEGPGRDRR